MLGVQRTFALSPACVGPTRRTGGKLQLNAEVSMWAGWLSVQIDVYAELNKRPRSKANVQSLAAMATINRHGNFTCILH